MKTVPTAITVPAGRSDGSLQVVAVSPLRAAALPLILTVGLPIVIVARLAGGFWNPLPGGVGICGGVLSALLSTVAAGIPMMLTSPLRPPLMIPTKGWGRGVGTGGDGGAGTMTICVSVAAQPRPPIEQPGFGGRRASRRQDVAPRQRRQAGQGQPPLTSETTRPT